MDNRSRYSLRDVKRTLEKNRKRLLALPNVLYLAVGEKIRAVAGQGRLAVRVCVSQKKRPRCRGAVPKRLRGIGPGGTRATFFVPTDVEKRPPRLVALGLRGGDSIVGATLGSAGLVFLGTEGEPLLLTNAHVTPGIDQTAAGQPVSVPAGRAIGHTRWATRLSSVPGQLHSVDAAVVVPTVPVDPFAMSGAPATVAGYGSLDHRTAQSLFYLRRNGARTRLHRPHWVATPRPVDMEGRTLLFWKFWELAIESGPRPAHGDSGAVVLSDSGVGLVVHGLLFAGGGATIGAVAIDAVFAALAPEGRSD